MTIGQRIAQKRKELALSQEALGEQLGVSRQAIYKWESDAALPEIDKLIALAKLFGVSVGWLLGVEEAPEAAQPDETESPPPPQNDLSEAQLAMVKEIVEQYLAAQPQPKPRRRWPFVLAALVLILVGSRLFTRLEQLNQQYTNLQYSVSNVTATVDHQINGISSRVEEILKAQNNLTAEYGTEIKSANLTQNQITFSVYAVPKTFVEGMQAVFIADDGTDLNAASETVERHHNQKFSTDITCGLTNSIALSVAFIYPDGTRQTQLLDAYEYLYSGSMPSARVHAHRLMFAEAPGGHLELPEHAATIFLEDSFKELSKTDVTITDVQVGLFLNRKLVMWAEPATEQPNDPYPYATELLYEFPPLDIQLAEEDELCVAAVLTDNFGRQTVAHDIPYILDTEDNTITHPSYSEMDSDPANWDFD